jgi:hypothetical protein
MTASTLRQQLLSLSLAVLVTTGLIGGVDRLASHYGEAAQPAGWAAAPAAQPAPAPARPAA